MFQCNGEKDLDDDHGGIPGRPCIWVSTHTIWYALSFVSADGLFELCPSSGVVWGELEDVWEVIAPGWEPTELRLSIDELGVRDGTDPITAEKPSEFFPN